MYMKHGSTLFLKLVILLIGILVFALCTFVLPQGIRSDSTGYYRPILIGMYIPAIPFFIALFHGLKLLDFIEKNKVFSIPSVHALQTIKKCSFIVSGLYTAGMPYIFTVADKDDAPGVVLIGFIIIFASLIVGTAASLFQRLLQNVIDLKSENELTV